MAQKFVTPITIKQLSSAGSDGLTIFVDADSYARLQIQAGGRLVWGDGSAAGDVNLYRDAADVLKTDDTLKVPVLFIDGIEVDTTGATTDQVLKYNGTKFLPAADGGSGGGSYIISVTAPVSPSVSDVWFNSDNGRTYIYYNDGNTSQWVEFGNANVGNAVPSSGGTMTGDLSVPSVIVTGTAGAGDIILPSQSVSPPLPSAGNLALYATTRTGRISPSWVLPSGVVRTTAMLPPDRKFQLGNGGLAGTMNQTGYGQLAGSQGLAGTLSSGSPDGQTITSAATASALANKHSVTIASRTSGFFVNTRVTYQNASYDNTGASTGSAIYGLYTSTGYLPVATPVATTANIAFYRGHVNGGRTDTNWQFVTATGGSPGTIAFDDTGMAFAVNKTYDFSVWCPAGGSTVFWQIDNITDSTTASGSTSASLPAIGTGIAYGTGLITVDAVARSLQFQRLYVEESG